MIRSADALREMGTDVEVLPLGLKYRDIQDLTDHNDVGVSSGGQPGDVLACLRLWARIGAGRCPAGSCTGRDDGMDNDGETVG